jgi:hypothetical protein
MGAILLPEGQRNLQEIEKKLRDRLVAAEAKKPTASIEVHNRMPAGHETAEPDEPDLSHLTPQEKLNYAFWAARVNHANDHIRKTAKAEILKLVPDWTPVEVRARRKTGERAAQFISETFTVDAQGRRVSQGRRLIGMSD